MKSVPKALLVAAGAVLAILLAAWGAVTVLLPPARVRALVERQLAATLARPVRYESVALSLFPPVRIGVRGFALAEPGGFEKGAALQSGELALDLDAFALLRNQLVVRRMVLVNPAMHLVLRADGTTNFDGLMKPQTAAAKARAPLDLELRDVSIRGGRVLVDRIAARQRMAMAVDAALTIVSSARAGRFATSGRTRITEFATGPLTALRIADLDNSLAAITWQIEHRGKVDGATRRLALEKLSLAFGRTAIEASGVVDEMGATPRLDLRAKGSNVDLAEILRVLSVADARALRGITGAGKLAFDLAIRGRMKPGAAPALSGTLALRNGAFHYAGAASGADAVSFTARLAPDSIGIGDFAGHVSGQPIHGSLSAVRLGDPLVRFALQGNLDLAAIAPLLAPRGSRLGGRAAVNVKGAGRAKSPASMALSGVAKLLDVSFDSPQLAKKLDHINGDIEFSSQQATIRGLTVRAGQSTAGVDATVDGPLALLAEPGAAPPAHVNFTLRSPYLDVVEVLPANGSGPRLPNATGGGTVRIERLRQGRLDVSNVVASVTLLPAEMNVPSFSLAGYGGAATGAAHFDLHNRAVPVVKVNAKVENVQADAILSAWTPAKGLINAALNTTVDLAVAGSTPQDVKRTLTAIGLAALGDGTIGPGPVFKTIAAVTRIPQLEQVKFTHVSLPFHAERGRIVTDNVKLSGNYGEWTMAGAIGFDGALDYALSITLPPEVAAALNTRSAMLAGAMTDDQGRTLLDLRVRGTARAPKVDWDVRAVQNRAAGRVSTALEEQKKKLLDAFKPSLNPGASPAESLARVRESLSRITADSLRNAAKDLLNGFFGKKKPPAPPVVTPPPPPPAPDTTRTPAPDTTHAPAAADTAAK